MPYKKRWDEDDVENAVALVQNGVSIRQAAIRNYIPQATLSRRMRDGPPQKRGPKTLMSEDDENGLVSYVIYMARAGEPVSVVWVKGTATRILKLR